MAALLAYILKMTSLLAIVWLFYFLALRRHTFYNANRWYFLAGTVIAFLLPVVSFPAAISQNGLVQETVRQISEIDINLLFANAAQTQPATLVSAAEAIVWPINVGILLFFGRLCLRMFSFFKLKRNVQKQIIAGASVYVVKENISPFSFLGNIFLSTGKHTDTEMAEIIIHEQAHIRQWHIVDLLLMEIVAALCWFNPFAWLLRGAVRQNLEYLADRKVLNAGFDTAHYQYNLLRTSVTIDGVAPVGNSFIFSNLKKRIIMMNKKRSSHIALLKYVLVVPLACFAWIALHAGELSAKLDEMAVVHQEHPVQKKSQERSIQNLPTEKEWEAIAALYTTSDTVKKTTAIKMNENALYILDGKEISEKELKDLDTKNIENITVLKDESATKLYGEKAKNGVVIISTEKDQKETAATKSNVRIFSKKEGSGNHLLYIINGEEVSAGKIKNIDKKDIKNITVLKDTVAVEVYRGKGKNGEVYIMIDTLEAKKSKVTYKEISVTDKDTSKTIRMSGCVTITTDSEEGITYMFNDEKVSFDNIKTYIKDFAENGKDANIVTGNNVIVMDDDKSIVNTVTIGGDRFMLRGEHTDKVLVVVDGKEINLADGQQLKREDIGDVTILKDDSAIKLYGEKAKNGVIVITSKSATDKKEQSNPKK